MKIAIFGGSGRMGRELIELIRQDKTLLLCSVLDQKSDLKTLSKNKPDVVIEFSSPSGLKKISDWCVTHRVPLVSGTTGVTENLEKLLKKKSSKVAIFRAVNMSLGVNALAKVIKIFAQDFPGCDVQIEEIHHRHKKDNPSGTAKFLQKQIEGVPSVRIQSAVGLRGGEVFGIHKVYFFAKNEWLCFEHHAQNRKVFAEGALSAANWVINQKPGLYNMSDFLK
jgi:4-hydroxy-tetrahydrodipicolinate reductase